MTVEDVAWLVRWDDDPDVAAVIGGRGADEPDVARPATNAVGSWGAAVAA
jgi:hypothetical protein